MRKEDALKLSENAVTELANALAEGKSKALTVFLDVMSRFHQYSIGNCILIAQQRPTATQVAGYSAWKKLKRSVKKGEKGICILAPLLKKEESDDGETKTVFGYRAVHVFDVSQTEGEDLPGFAEVTGDPGEQLIRLREVVRSRGIELTYEDYLGGAEGVSRGGAIALLKGHSQAKEYAVLAHELAHEMLHRGSDRGEYSKVIKELEAEATAYVVVKSAGLENGLNQAADYIQLYSGDKEKLMDSLDRICSIAASILADLEKVRPSRVQPLRASMS